MILPRGMNEHYGRNTEKMPELLRAGEVPISTARFMKARLTDGNEFPDLWNDYVGTSDLVIYPKGNDKEIYVLLTVDNQDKITETGRKALKLINPQNIASNDGARVRDLEELECRGLIKVPINKIVTETYLTQEQILNEIVWRILARHPEEVPTEFAEDKRLLQEYSKEVGTRTKNSENMAIYLGNSLEDVTILKAWFVSWLDLRSSAVGRYDLDYGGGRLVGLAPEAQSSLAKGVQGVRAYTMNDVQEAREQLKRLEEFVKPESLERVTSLIAKL